MSEYQYYSFRAVDRPLSFSEMKQLRDISSRAEITAESFVNEYNCGDLKANPRDLQKFMTEHRRRKALVTRLEKVGLRQVPM